VLEEGKQIFRFDTFGDEAFWAIPSSFIGDRGNEIWRSRRRRQPEDSTRCRLESRHGCPSRASRRENQARPSQPGQTEDNSIGGGARPFASAKLMRSGRSRMSITRSPLTWRAARRRWISSLSSWRSGRNLPVDEPKSYFRRQSESRSADERAVFSTD